MFLCILVTFVPSFIFSNEHFFLLLLNTTTVEIVEELSRIILLDFSGEVLLRGELEELSTEPLVTEWLWSSSTIGVPLLSSPSPKSSPPRPKPVQKQNPSPIGTGVTQ